MAPDRSATRMPRALRALLAIVLAGIGVSAVEEGTSLLDGMLGGAPAEAIYDATLIGAAVLVLARAALRTSERAAWTVLGAGLLSYAGGNVVWSILYAADPAAPYPSLSDALWIGLYPAAYAAVVMLVRRRLPQLGGRLWLDGLCALLVACALAAAVVVETVGSVTGGDLATVVTSLAYPIGDMILVGLVVGAMVAGRGRLDRTWGCLSLGVLVFAGVDAVYGYQVAEGTYVEGTLMDILWPVGALLIGIAAWQPAVRVRARADVPSVVVPVAFALTALAILIYDHFDRISHVALALDGLAMLSVVARFGLTHRQSRANLAHSRRLAETDVLTGLGSRHALMSDLEALEPSDEHRPEPHVLLLFDLDGFKTYNDAFGHPAGDALLARLGSRLAAAVAGGGRAYRMGGDEFCVLAPGREPALLLERARTALIEQGDGFAIGSSYGHVLLPEEAAGAIEALQVADRRLYAQKQGGRVSPGAQSAGVLCRALDVWDAELGSHGQDVAAMAAGVAVRLGLDGEAVERVTAAAALHDVGKIAVPREILHKPGRLDEEEWAFIRRHTLIGERIVQAAPALAGVGRLIRFSHERWDGGGYPDGLAGADIPLGSQIVFICDAFSAMTAQRSYGRPLSEQEALAELRRNAGTQFAPDVVEAFVAERTASAAVPHALPEVLAAPVARAA